MQAAKLTGSLARLLADRSAATAHPDPAPADQSEFVRVAVDGPVEKDTGALADALAEELRAQAVPVARVRARDFVRARSLRLEYGRDDPEAFYRLWYDLPALTREVLEPLGPGGDGRWLPRLRDAETDRAFRDRVCLAPPGTVAVIDGRFLLRNDVRWDFDVTAHLSVSEPARARRVPEDERARVLPAWDRYLTDDDPEGRADIVVRFDHPDRPAVLVDNLGL